MTWELPARKESVMLDLLASFWIVIPSLIETIVVLVLG